MRRRFTSRPAPAASAITAFIGVFMLIFALAFFSKAGTGGGFISLFLVVWVLAVIAVIIYHVTNAVRPGGVPNNIIESEDDASPAPKSSAERLRDLEELRNCKLISDAEYERKRQEILNEV